MDSERSSRERGGRLKKQSGKELRAVCVAAVQFSNRPIRRFLVKTLAYILLNL